MQLREIVRREQNCTREFIEAEFWWFFDWPALNLLISLAFWIKNNSYLCSQLMAEISSWKKKNKPTIIQSTITHVFCKISRIWAALSLFIAFIQRLLFMKGYLKKDDWSLFKVWCLLKKHTCLCFLYDNFWHFTRSSATKNLIKYTRGV